MALYNPKPHHGLVSEYQQSGIPWCKNIRNAASLNVSIASGTDAKLADTISFPYVTRWIAVSSPAACWIAFAAAGEAAERVFYIPANSLVRLELKCKTLLVYASANPQNIYVQAGLTNVKGADFPDITALSGIGA